MKAIGGSTAPRRRKRKRTEAFSGGLPRPVHDIRHDQTRRAQKRAPKRAVPALPVLKDPTPKQRHAIRDAHTKVASSPAVARELAMDPRQRNFVKAVNAAMRVDRGNLRSKVAERAG